MAIKLLEMRGVKIFVASPSGLKDERKKIVDIVQDFNKRRAHLDGFVFIPNMWEDMPSSFGRPQETINKKFLETSHFVLVMFADKWGAPTGKYTSGTQEEFENAKSMMDENKLYDMALFFKKLPKNQTEDPGEELKEVRKFRDERKRQKDIYFEYFCDDDFETIFSNLLSSWLDKLNENNALYPKYNVKDVYEGGQ